MYPSGAMGEPIYTSSFLPGLPVSRNFVERASRFGMTCSLRFQSNSVTRMP
jgi:hypothetical protein